jgi:serine protease
MKLRPLAAVMAVAFAAPSLAAESVTQMIVKFDNEKVRAQALAEGVRLPTTGERLNALSATLGEVVSYQRPMSGGADVIRFTHPVDMERAQAMASVLSERSDVAWAEPDARMYIRRVPNDPRYAEQWSLHASVTGQPVGQNNYGLDMPAAWSLLTGASTPVVVAVLDSGILPQHEDLAGRVLPGYDMISPPEVANDNDPAGAANSRDPDPTDAGDWITQAESDDPNGPYQGCEVHPSSWHGSHVAGKIGRAHV